MKDTSKLTKLGKLVVKTLTDKNMARTQLAETVGMPPQYLSYIFYGTHSDEKYIPTIIAAPELDPRKVERAITT